MTIYERLIANQDKEYQIFQAKLVPNIDSNLIIGVRTPVMRDIAKEVYGSNEASLFLNDLPHKYYEENLVHMFLISMIKDFDKCINEINTFLPFVNCWPVSDQGSPNVFKKNHERLIEYIKEWINSNHVYTVRFGIRMLMNEYLGEDFKGEYLELVASIKGEDYYLKMMIAWYFATALAKRWDEAIIYFEKHMLDEWVHKKAIQKAIESYRVSEEHKEYLRSLK